MEGDVCRSRLVCRELKEVKNKDEQLGPDDVFSLVSTAMREHDDGNHTDGPIVPGNARGPVGWWLPDEQVVSQMEGGM